MSETFILGFEIVSVLFALFDFFYAYKSYRQAEEMGRFLGASAFSAGVIVICYLFSIRPGTYLSASVAASLYFSGIDWMLVSLTHFIFLYTGRNKTKLSIYARRMIRVIAAADSVIIPVQAAFLSVKGMEQLINTIKKVRNRINPALRIEGILMTTR